MATDADLLRRYADAHDENAFGEIVRRHLTFVYSVALRQVGGDAHLAQDVCQQVFVDLSRKSRALADRRVLSGWLYRSTQFAASSVVRQERARRSREREAQFMHELSDDSAAHVDWDKVRPVLDEAISELGDSDRDAVLLRFLESRSFADIGGIFRLSEDAARMRVERALKKLRTTLARRGVKSTSAALAVAFANQFATAAPPRLAASITGAALAGSTSGGLAAAGTLIFMSTKSTVIVSVVALVAIGSTCYQWTHARRTDAELARVSAERNHLQAQALIDRQRSARDLAAVQGEIRTLKAKLAEAGALTAQKASGSAPTHATSGVTIGLPRWQIQKSTLSNLRHIDAARKSFKNHNGILATSINELVGPEGAIRILHSIDGEDYSKLSMNPEDPMTVTTSSGISVTLDPSGVNTTVPQLPPEAVRFDELAAKLGPSIDRAVSAYRAANLGNNPTDQKQLLPFFATPQEGADFVEFLDAQKAAGIGGP